MIAVDWGSSAVRAYRLSDSGSILERRTSSAGVFDAGERPFHILLEELVGDWLVVGEAPVVMSGMIGSRRGWAEVPYRRCPARLSDLATGCLEVRWESRRAWIVPGLECRSAAGAPDVMRGEETQVLGSAGGLPDSSLLCLPGTHTKWAEYANGAIQRFRTSPTGELYRLLVTQSSLITRRTDGAIDPAGFAAGVERAAEPGGLLHHLFGVRAAQMTGDLSEEAAASFLSGVLIGHEVNDLALAGRPVHLLGAAPLTALYRAALERRGVECIGLDPDAAAAGLFLIGSAIPGAS